MKILRIGRLCSSPGVGIFITFAESLDLCLKSSIPVLLLALTLLGLTISSAALSRPSSTGWLGWGRNATESTIDFARNDLLLGSQDPIFLFLVPLFGLISVGICVGVNCASLALTNLFYLPYKYLTARPAWVRVEDVRYAEIQVSVYDESYRLTNM